MEITNDDRLFIAIECDDKTWLLNDLDDVPSILIKQIRSLLNGKEIKIYLHKRTGGLPYPQVKKSD